MKKPVFIVGIERSGTTWLANILCQHSNITGIQAKRHYGIHESVFFSNIEEKFGNLSDDNNFIQLVEILSSSDYFILSGLNKDILYEERPKTYHDFFRLIMERFAEKRKADFWLEKTPSHSLYLEKISKYYPDAKFIAIKRDIVDTIKSTIRLEYG